MSPERTEAEDDAAIAASDERDAELAAAEEETNDPVEEVVDAGVPSGPSPRETARQKYRTGHNRPRK